MDTSPSRKKLWIAFLIVALAGCNVTMKQYDPMTVKQINNTIDFEERDFEETLEDLGEAEASDQAKNGATTRHKAEMSRLRAWLLAEEAKKLEDVE